MHVPHQGGVRSLWSGNLILCLTVAPENAIMYYTYNWIKQQPNLCKNPDAPTLLEKLSAGGLSGMAALTCVYPLYVAQARLAIAGPGTFNGLGDFFVKTIQTDGLSAFGRGYVPSILRAFPSKGVELCVYNTLREIMVPQGEQPSTTQSLVFGAISAICSQTLTMPLLLLRTKMIGQVRGNVDGQL